MICTNLNISYLYIYKCLDHLESVIEVMYLLIYFSFQICFMQHSCMLVRLGYFSPTALRSLTRSSCVALGWSLTFLILLFILPHEARSCMELQTDGYFVFLNNGTNSCLADGLVALSSLVQVYSLSLMSFHSSLVFLVVLVWRGWNGRGQVSHIMSTFLKWQD